MVKWQDVPQLKLIDWPKRLLAIGVCSPGCYIVAVVHYKHYKRARERSKILHQMLYLTDVFVYVFEKTRIKYATTFKILRIFCRPKQMK